MKMTRIIAISTVSILLSACSQQDESQPSAVMDGMGAEHIHNIEGFGDFTHSHSGNSTSGHSHSWEQMNSEITKKGLR